jgi:hypothetical protein
MVGRRRARAYFRTSGIEERSRASRHQPAERTDPSAAVAHGVDALNNSLGFADPASMFRYFSKTSFSPNGINWGHYADPRGRRPAHAGSPELRL